MNKDCVSREISREMVVGAFVLMIALGIGYFTILLSREPWFGPRREIVVCFDDVRGLREGDNVVVRGVTVGRVVKTEFLDSGVSVKIKLNHDLEFRKGYSIRVVPSSLLGGNYVRIDAGKGEPLEPNTPLLGTAPLDVMESAGAIIEELRQELMDSHLLASISSSAASLSNLLQRVERGESLLGKLFSEEDTTLYNNLASTVSNVNAIVARVEAGKGTVGRLLSEDDALYADFQEIAASARRIVTDVDAGKGSLGKLLREDELYNNINDAAASLKIAATDIRDQKGLIGKLISDETLAERVDSTINEVQAMIDDMRDTSPLSTFTSVFFGAF
jgi:phospholipid/cholesterol/gamma-HCH transport system substrate-binding protein